LEPREMGGERERPKTDKHLGKEDLLRTSSGLSRTARKRKCQTIANQIEKKCEEGSLQYMEEKRKKLWLAREENGI